MTAETLADALPKEMARVREVLGHYKEMLELVCPPLPPIRMRHKGDKINSKGGVSALCFDRPRTINMKKATWVMGDDGVTCPKCLAIMRLAKQENP